MAQLFWFNAHVYDQLAETAPVGEIPQRIEEMAACMLPALSENDALIFAFDAVPNFCHYLENYGISSGKTISLKDSYRFSGTGSAWGWSREAHSLFDSLAVPIHAPDATCVKKVNSRLFSLRQNTIPHAILISNKKDLALCPSYPIVFKPLLGCAGAHFIRITQENDPQERQLINALDNGIPFIAEPWLERICDFSTRADIAENGHVTIAGTHRNVCNKAGAFYANLLIPHDPKQIPWREEIVKATIRIGQELHTHGYFGPYSTDSFTYRTANGTEALATGFDINARHPISTITYALKRKIGTDVCIMYRFITRRRHILPETYTDFVKILKDIAYNPQEKRGVILMSPLRLKNAHKSLSQPIRSAFLIVAHSEEEILSLDEILRERLQR